MFTPEPVGRVRRRSFGYLGPGGRLGARTRSGMEHNPWMTCVGMAAMMNGLVAGGPPIGPGGIFSLSDPDELERLAKDASFADVTVEAIAVTSYPTPSTPTSTGQLVGGSARDCARGRFTRPARGDPPHRGRHRGSVPHRRRPRHPRPGAPGVRSTLSRQPQRGSYGIPARGFKRHAGPPVTTTRRTSALAAALSVAFEISRRSRGRSMRRRATHVATPFGTFRPARSMAMLLRPAARVVASLMTAAGGVTARLPTGIARVEHDLRTRRVDAGVGHPTRPARNYPRQIRWGRRDTRDRGAVARGPGAAVGHLRAGRVRIGRWNAVGAPRRAATMRVKREVVVPFVVLRELGQLLRRHSGPARSAAGSSSYPSDPDTCACSAWVP